MPEVLGLKYFEHRCRPSLLWRLRSAIGDANIKKLGPNGYTGAAAIAKADKTGGLADRA
jgi:hypothetical protein